ncbi:MAG TPA: hypothetical protein VHD57_17205 [Vicinamibacterales bacterium]|jgi:hypothetical protein|nr:hypothetical protein [Vicinamibacterales bacterium]
MTRARTRLTHGDVHARRAARRVVAVLMLIGGPAAFGCVAVCAPAWVTMGIAGAVACAWCVWLDRLDDRP